MNKEKFLEMASLKLREQVERTCEYWKSEKLQYNDIEFQPFINTSLDKDGKPLVEKEEDYERDTEEPEHPRKIIDRSKKPVELETETEDDQKLKVESKEDEYE